MESRERLDSEREAAAAEAAAKAQAEAAAKAQAEAAAKVQAEAAANRGAVAIGSIIKQHEQNIAQQREAAEMQMGGAGRWL